MDILERVTERHKKSGRVGLEQSGLITRLFLASSGSSSYNVGDRCTVSEQLLLRIVKRLRGGLVFKAHRLMDHSFLGLEVIEQM